MKSNVLKDLSEVGVNGEDAIERFMQNEVLYIKFLKKFLLDKNFEFLEKSIQEKDYQAALQYAHTLKGVCGNLSMVCLSQIFGTMVLQIREEDYSNMEQVFSEAKQAYDKVCYYIKENL